MFRLLFLAWMFLMSGVSASQVAICKTVHQTGYITTGSSSATDAIANFSLDLSASFNENDESFPNTLSVTNFMEWYSDPTVFKRVGPWSFMFYENPDKQIPCQSMDNCVVTFPNGLVEYHYNFSYRSYQDWSTHVNGPKVFIADGTFFNGEDATFLDQINPCMGEETAYPSPADILLWTTTCCTKFEYVEIPDSNNDVCQEFETVTKMTDPALNTPINLLAYYTVSSNSLLQIDIALLNAPDSVYHYDFYANYPIVALAQGDYGNPNTSFSMNLMQGSQYEFIFSYNPSEYRSWDSVMKYQGLIVGEIINHNGILLKNVNKSFTKTDPCWKKNAIVPFTNSTYLSSFCCRRFNTGTASTPQPSSTSYPATTTTTTTTPSPIDPRSNAIGALCSNDTSKAYLDIVFVFDTSYVMGNQNLRSIGAQISTLMYKFNIAQNGNHTTRAAITTYASKVSRILELKDVTNLNDFEKNLKNLTAHPNDSGGYISLALNDAYNLLKSQASHRIPMIVLVAAAYDPNGLQGADPTANITKQDGISIVVIHYVVDGNEELSSALQTISSPGFYYNTDRSGEEFYGSVSYAFTQINCACPTADGIGFMQLQVYEKAWNNFTRYADCYYSDGTASNPLIANDFCDPGNLIALTSQQKLDFIAHNFTKDNPTFKNLKKMSIGLHKSSDSTWKWWGYNNTEYPFGNFPIMSQTPAPNDNWGYMSRYGYIWSLLTANANDIAFPYICQQQACDAEYICSRAKKI